MVMPLAIYHFLEHLNKAFLIFTFLKRCVTSVCTEIGFLSEKIDKLLLKRLIKLPYETPTTQITFGKRFIFFIQ